MLRSTFSLCAAIFICGAAGCVGPSQPAGARMNLQIVAGRGTRTFPVERSKVFAASVGALKILGYQIAFADEGAGVIKTAPKTVHTEAYTAGGQSSYSYHGQAVLVVYDRSYALRLMDQQGSTIVEAAPRVYVNGKDVSSDPIWVLDGPQGEYALWDQLFQEIASNLGLR